MAYAPSSARISGSIASYIARVSAQSWTRLASSIRKTLSPKRLTLGDIDGLSSNAMQSSMYAVCRRFRRDIRVLRAETTIAIARANSCGESCRITTPPTDTGEVNGNNLAYRKGIHGYHAKNSPDAIGMSGFPVRLSGHRCGSLVNPRSSSTIVYQSAGVAR